MKYWVLCRNWLPIPDKSVMKHSLDTLLARWPISASHMNGRGTIECQVTLKWNASDSRVSRMKCKCPPSILRTGCRLRIIFNKHTKPGAPKNVGKFRFKAEAFKKINVCWEIDTMLYSCQMYFLILPPLCSFPFVSLLVCLKGKAWQNDLFKMNV